ncbi:TolC family protein [Dysgonomonas sp. 25]|uniref:TolC family protein n=1 Tax=Dysgonomonas sp. 25 TaxID=2302933 RepID=UPI0013D51F2D|nr:TolC family protein [Dysgonomonas sp. 25]NDV69397.1 TolC family protein [Dysgonomonas sp. 25]
MATRIYLISIVLLFCSAKVAGQQYFTLEECRQLAIDNNKALKIASEEERIAYYEKKEALMNFFPKVAATGSYLHFGRDLHLIGRSSIPANITLPVIGNITIPENIQNDIYRAGRIDMSDFWIGGISLTQPIFAGGKIIAYHDLRSYAEELAKSQRDTKLTDIIVEVDEAYWQVVSLANKEKLAESYVQSLQKMDNDIQAMLDEGVATKADRLSVSVKLNEAEMTLTKARNGVSLSKMLLCQLCGIEITDAINVADEKLPELVLDEETPTNGSAEEAIANRQEIKSLELATKIYKKQENITFSEFLPTAGLSVGYMTTKPNLNDGFENEFGGMWNVGVKVTIPLNFITSSTKLNAAKARTRIARYELEDAKEKIRLQVSQQTYKLAEANKKLTAAGKNAESADENLYYANTGFEEGVISATDALLAHTAWLSAHAEKVDAQIDVKLCRIYLNKALGRSIR